MQTAMKWLLDATSSSLIVLDEAGYIAFANAPVETLFGYATTALLGQPADVLIAQRSRAAFAVCRVDLMRDGPEPSARVIPAHAVCSDGTELKVTLNLSLVSVDGKRCVMVSVLDDTAGVSRFEHLAVALEAAPTGMILADGAGRIVLVNARTNRLFGYARGELVGVALEQLVPERLRHRYRELRRGAFQNAPPRALGRGQDLYGLHRDQREVPVDIGLNAFTMNGRTFVLCAVVDNTDHERVLDQLQATLDAAQTGILLANDEGRIVLVNAPIERTFGYSRDELLGQPVGLLVPSALPDDNRPLKEYLAPSDGRPAGAARDLYGLRRDGCQVPVEVALTSIASREGPFVLTSVIDNTDRMRIEGSLRDDDARYHEHFNDSPVALLEQDFSETRSYLLRLQASGVEDLRAHLTERPDALLTAIKQVKTVMVNQQALLLLESQSASEVSGSAPFLSAETSAWFLSGLCHLLAGEHYFAQETLARTVKGRLLSVSKRMRVLPGHQETWSRVVVSLFDLSPYKQAEAQLRASLQEKELLLKEVHHRVKNNLQVVSSLLKLKADALIDPAMQRVFADCQSRVQSIASVHDQLYMSDDLAHVPFGGYVRTLVEHLSNLCMGTGRRITSRIDIDDIKLNIDDAIPCALIVNELVTNALRHAFPPAGEGCIDIRMRKVGGTSLELTVSDNGRGLPSGFEPLGEDASGLELVYTLAEQLRAEVDLKRTGGTRFEFRFTPGGSTRPAQAMRA